MHNEGTPPRTPCNTLFKDPYFTPLGKGKEVNVHETILYDQLGWAITVPRGDTTINLELQASEFQLDHAYGFHDHNWALKPLDQFAYTWLFGAGSCGPFDLGYVEVQALGSSRPNDVLDGFLAYDTKFLQNQCSLYGSKTEDYINITLTGQTYDSATKQTVPTGLILDYFLANGSHYSFPLTNTVENPALAPYHRWRLPAREGLWEALSLNVLSSENG